MSSQNNNAQSGDAPENCDGPENDRKGTQTPLSESGRGNQNQDAGDGEDKSVNSKDEQNKIDTSKPATDDRAGDWGNDDDDDDNDDADADDNDGDDISNASEAGSRPVSQCSDAASVNLSVYNLNAYTADNNLSNEDFLHKLAKGQLLLCKEIQEWKKKYKHVLGDLDNDVTKLLKQGIRLEDEGLSQEDMKVVKSRLRELDTMPIVKLVDYVHLCTFN